MKKGLGILLLTVLLTANAALFVAPTIPVNAQTTTKIIVFCTSYGMGNKLLENITDWLEGQGYTVRIANGGLNSTILAGAGALILGSPYGSEGMEGFNATNAPTIFNTIKDWFDEGQKFIWVSGDSDYGSLDWASLNASKILETIGSALRLEPASVEDPYSNCGRPYRVVANETITTGDAYNITKGVTHGVLFHGPTSLYAISGGNPVALENETVPNVFNIMRTSKGAVIVENNPLVQAVVHKEGRVGSWVMMAGEKNAGPDNNNRIIVSGASPFGDYQPLWTDEYYNVPLNGSLLVKQAIEWGLEAVPWVTTGVPTTTTPPILLYAAIAAVVIIIVIVIVVVIWLRRRGGG